MSLFRFALYLVPENLRPSPNSKVCAHDAHSNLVFLHFPRLSDLSLFFFSVPLFLFAWREKLRCCDAGAGLGRKAYVPWRTWL